MRKLSLSEVPRDAEQAVRYIVFFIHENWSEFFASDKISPKKRDELSYALEILKIALAKNQKTSNFQSFSEFLEKNWTLSLLGEFPIAQFAIHIFASIRAFDRLDIEKHFDVSEDELRFVIKDADVDRATKLIDECRVLIVESEQFDAATKTRLLRRLDEILRELKGKQGRLDVILGGIVEFGEALGQFGSAAKPLFDRISEIRGVAQRGMKNQGALPPPARPQQKTAPAQSSKNNQINDVLAPKLDELRAELGLKVSQVIDLLSAHCLKAHKLDVPVGMRTTARKFLAFLRQNLDQDAILAIMQDVRAQEKKKS